MLGSEIVRWLNTHVCNLGCAILMASSLANASFCCRIKFYYLVWLGGDVKVWLHTGL